MPFFAPQTDEFCASLEAAILEESPDGILVVSQEGLVVSVNTRFFTVWDIPKPAQSLNEALNISDSLFLEQVLEKVQDPASFLQRVRELYADPLLEDTSDVPLKDGRTLRRHSKALCNPEGQYLGRVWYFRDISEIIKSRIALDESEKRYHTAFHTSLDAIAITSLADGIYIDVNPAFLSITGFERDELIGKSSVELNIWADSKDRDHLRTMLRNDEANLRLEARFRKKDGELFWGMMSVSRMDIGGTACLLSLTRDTTANKAAQEELARHRDHLEQLIEERTAELQHAKDAAETASVAKSAFLANMSHEIRTPLNAITGLAFLIRRGGLNPVQTDQLEKLENASKHLLNVINAVLEISKIEAGKFAVSESSIHIGSILENVASMLRARTQEKHLYLSIELESMPPNLLGDPTALQQALLNYASNAVKFTESGSVVLRARKVDEDAGHALLRFEVEDTGIGIDAETLSRLFMAFEQADNSMTRKYGGSGLGLAITKKLAEQMGGTTGASSVPGKGSTFWFTVRLKKGTAPLPDVRPGSLLSAEDRLSQHFPEHRMLLVEDEPINREIASMMLTNVRQIIDIAEDGVEAVELVLRNKYDLILMDMQMPNMDGLEATRRIRALPNGSAVPILAMTANVFEDDRERCIAAGMDDFVGKPIDPVTLYSTILRHLEKTAR